jgi:hypothetical protein
MPLVPSSQDETQILCLDPGAVDECLTDSAEISANVCLIYRLTGREDGVAGYDK